MSPSVTLLGKPRPAFQVCEVRGADVFRPTEGDMAGVDIARYKATPCRRRPWHALKPCARLLVTAASGAVKRIRLFCSPEKGTSRVCPESR